jgi:carbon catabolite-derepressing protein kinase
MSIEALMQHAWFKKSLQEKAENDKSLFRLATDCNKDDMLKSMTAFDIISLSSGLDLLGLFETTVCERKEKRFTTRASGRSEHEGEAVYCTCLTTRGSEHEGEVKRRRVGAGEAKIGRFFVKNARESHVLGIPSKLPEKVNNRFILQVLETSGGKLLILKL